MAIRSRKIKARPKSVSDAFGKQFLKDKAENERVLKAARPGQKLDSIRRPESFERVLTGISGFDKLLSKGIPKGSSVLVAGGPGTGKTILCLQTLVNNVKKGEKGLYMSFEEPEWRLRQHMHDFGWDPETYEEKGLLMIKRFDPFDITRSVEALLTRAKKELLIDVEPVFFPPNFRPSFIVLDSMSAVAAAFVGREDSYRIYIEQLFRFFEELGATSLLITEIDDPESLSLTRSGVEGFLADGIILMRSVKVTGGETTGGERVKTIEILKMRGESFQQKIVEMQIISGKGIVLV
ncbi:MAG: AAA family ATPase [Candidatus Aenigmarchaeota archaeon]|nr:AAA family ATPase [Candidatus Aenigmarchaeota archaeon]